MAFEFIQDLDGYFAEKYENYDKICMLKGYEMPKMQTTVRREDGSDYSYTLPASTMRLSAQKHPEELLKELKGKLRDPSFSFSFRPVGLFKKLKNRFSKTSFAAILPNVLNRHQVTAESAGELLNIDQKVWKKIVSGGYMPTKNLVFSLALAVGLTSDDLSELLTAAFLGLDYALVKDTVVAYLVSRSIRNREMIDAALKEYSIENLFLK